VELGYGSLFHFLHRDLGLSKGAAHHRKTVAELVQRFPEIVGPLRDGRLCITSVVHLAKVLTSQNQDVIVLDLERGTEAEPSPPMELPLPTESPSG